MNLSARWWLIFLANRALVVVVDAQNQLNLRPIPSCVGTMEIVTIGMETNGEGVPYSHNDLPTTLPENVMVTGYRRSRDNFNDIKVFDTKQAAKGDNLFSSSVGNVIIIEREDRPSLEDNLNGGRIQFRFGTPVYSVEQVKILGAGDSGESFIVGRDNRDRKLSEFNFPSILSDNVSSVSPEEWFNVKELNVVLRGEGGVFEIDVKVCRGELREICGTGQQLTSGGFCLPCQPGNFNDNGKCRACKDETISRNAGAVECVPCGILEIANSAKTKCISADNLDKPCLPGFFGVGGSDCKQCRDGTMSSTAGQISCTACPDGMASTPDRSGCVTVATGSPISDVTTEPPRTDSTTKPSRTDPTTKPPRTPEVTTTSPPSFPRCQPGYYSPGPDSECKKCAQGSISSVTGKKCKICPPGKTSNADQTRCVKVCSPGSYGAGGEDCRPCASNRIAKDAGQKRCEKCRKKWQPNRAQTRCVKACKPGTVGIGLGNCKKCKVGYVAKDFGWLQCKKCPDGKTSNKKRDKCIKVCDKGYHGSGGAHCEKCPEGSISNKVGQKKCSGCPRGTVPNTDRTKCMLDSGRQ